MPDDVDISNVIRTLRDMDRMQTETDESGGREIAWYYYREDVERDLGLKRNALNTAEEG